MVQSTISLEQITPEPPGEPAHQGCGGCGSGRAQGGSQCGNGLEKIYPTTAVRFGYMKHIGEFTHQPDMKFTCGAKVVIQTRRGIEIGEQVSLSCSGCDRSVSRDKIKNWVANCGSDAYLFEAGRILREATAADLAEYARIQDGLREKRQFCQRLADRLSIRLKIVECECPFGGERIVFYFTSEERVDFRAMVRELAREYRTRIEMRQIGARDEARLLADFETCGREVCCKVFLKTLRPISMRMAKVQKATLDPTQVSGRCGRLKCCLRYEHVGYEELDKRLPRMGSRIRTAHGEGEVVNRQILTQLVQFRKGDGELLTVVVEDILETDLGPAAPSETPTKPSEPKGGRSPGRNPAGRNPRGGRQDRKLSSWSEKTDEPKNPETAPLEGGQGSEANPPDPSRPRSGRERRNSSRGGPGHRPGSNGLNRPDRRDRGGEEPAGPDGTQGDTE